MKKIFKQLPLCGRLEMGIKLQPVGKYMHA